MNGRLPSRQAIAGFGIRNWPALSVIGFFVLAVAIMLRRVFEATDGRLVYALDDPYIHLAVARSLRDHGSWGISGDVFAPVTSSLLWPILVLMCHLLGIPLLWAPLVLTLVAGVGLIGYAWVQLRNAAVPAGIAAAALLAIVWFAPLPTLVLDALEHPLHALLTVVVAAQGVRIIAGNAPVPRILHQVLGVMALVAVRYEGVFLVGALSALAAFRGLWRTALLWMAAALVPVAVFAGISIGQGWFWLPSSLLLKAEPLQIQSWGDVWYRIIERPGIIWRHAPHLQVLFIVTGLALLLRVTRGKRFWERGTLLLSVTMMATAGHLMFAHVGQFFRYEAYLVVLHIFALTLAFAQHTGVQSASLRHSQLAALSVAALFVSVPLLGRSDLAWRQNPVAAYNMWEQLQQMGLFLATYYPDEAVAVNDIGAPAWHGAGKIVDLWGLATRDVAWAQVGGYYNTSVMRQVASEHRVQVAIVYEHWFSPFGGLPPEWRKAGEWHIHDRIATGGDAYAIFAVDPGAYDHLVQNLREFAPRLPSTVTQVGAYVEQDQ